MNTKQRKTLNLVFTDPISPSIKWSDIELCLISLGATITEGRSSRARVVLNGERAVFHRPHPDANTDKGAVKSVRRFLINAGVKNDDV